MRALELILIGEPCDAARAQELGLVLEVVAPERLLPRAREQAKKILARGPLAVAQVKRIVHAGAGMSLEDALELERQAFAATFASADAREGMKAFLEKRPPRFQGE
jgi:enoyl-CoA hydratase